MAAPTAPPTAPLGDVVRWRARAEWFEIDSLLGYRDAEMARTAHVEPARRRQVERSAIALTIAEATHLSEGQVQLRLSAADRVREQAPTVWEAFADGVVDWSRVRDIASTIDQLEREESITRLDCLVVPYAACHTGAELRQWLRRFVHRVEADLASPRADTARRDRHVSIRHGDDAMSWLNAYLPSHEAAAIEQRLRAEARRPVDDADDRTIAQREADVLVGWCLDEDASTGSTGTTASTGGVGSANIAVTIDADVLAGVRAGFAESADGRWGVPAAWISAVVATGSTFWHRILTQPVTGDVLSHEYLGRFAPDVLDIALQYLHEVCQAPGCLVPAGRCDIDHRVPHPEGITTAANLGPLCRRHHLVKGHGVLRWSTAPPANASPPRAAEIYVGPTPVPMEYVAA